MSPLRRLARRLRSEEGGWALATTIMVTLLMVSLGLATLAFVDGQTRTSARDRQAESDFNLAEGVFNAQVYILSHAWPESNPSLKPLAPNYPASCTEASASAMCPDSGSLAGSYDTPDFATGLKWTSEVHDNDKGDTPSFYNDNAASDVRWDSNQDHKVWVRAQATIRGRTRVVVGLVQIEQQSEDLPHAAIVAGSLSTGNNGNKDIICTRLPDDVTSKTCTSSSSLADGVLLRCTGGLGTSCQNYRDGQISPDPVQTGYSGSGLSADALDRLRQRAISEGTYYATGCPPSPAGAMVFVEHADCTYTTSTPGPWNSPTSPGMYIVNWGSLHLLGNQIFYGVIYAANAQNAVGCNPGCPVELGGTTLVRGGIQVSGQGGVLAGSSGMNVMADDYAFNSVVSYGAASIVQNKWREIVPRAGT